MTIIIIVLVVVLLPMDDHIYVWVVFFHTHYRSNLLPDNGHFVVG